ncbi:MAG: DUF885 domain-containing protein [Chloroflexi bacterium]|nr:DUF885 domain-containing protein [Chloroflexota bacterium]
MAESQFATVADEWMAAVLEHRPEAATRLGVHDHDAQLGDRSRSSVERWAARLRGVLAKLEGIDAARLAERERPDYELLRRLLQWELVTIDDLETWRRSPGGYLGAIGGGCNGLIIRDFAPLAERVESLTSRLRQAPEVLDQAKANLSDCPRVHVETAIEQAAGLRVLFQRDLPEAVAGVEDAGLQSQFAEANEAATAAMAAFAGWLQDELLPRSDGDFRYGEKRFRQLLSYADFVDRPLDELERRGKDDLRATQERLAELAGQIDSSKTTAEVVDSISREHPAPERLVPDTADLLEELRQFSIDQGMGSMPTEVRIEVTETPAFSRSTVQAACSTPGAFEEKAQEAYYYVTPPDASWPAERTEAYLKFFNRYSLPGITAHEAYPGHYVHISWLRKVKERLPHFLLTTTAVEGWAHYIEQVLVEAGYGDGDPRYEIMQLREALLRLCRYLVSFGLHTQDWDIDESIAFFEREGYATRPIAEREARRGVMGPQYYAYTLGKHEILSLREKLKAKQGAAYDQLAFHDAFMKLPYPVSVIEKMLLSEE